MAKPILIGLSINHSYTYYRDVLRGIVRYAETRPSWRFVPLIPEQEPLEALGRLRPAGLIASINNKQLLRALRSWRRPVVNVSDVLPELRFPSVGVDDVLVGQQAAAHLLERGLRNFGFLGPSNFVYSIRRRTAFCDALREAGHSADCCYLPDRPFDTIGSRWNLNQDVYRWLKKLPKPVGVFTPADETGAQVVEACRHVGLRVPEDVAILGVDDDDLLCTLVRPRMSSVVLPAEKIGYEAAALLDRLLAGSKPPAAPLLLPPSGVVKRRSTEVLAFDDPEIVAAVRYVRDHAHLPLSIDQVARQVAIARRTLERRCQAALGWSLGQEIRRAHLERAQRLLSRTDLPVKAVAEQSGFSGLRHMGDAFRQALGITPTTFRRRARSFG